MSILRRPQKVTTIPGTSHASARVVAVLAGLMTIPTSAIAEDWERFRGPDLNGISREGNLLREGDPKVAWRAKVGLGHAGFVVGDGRAFTTGHTGKDTDTVYCFDSATGNELWKHSYPHPLDDLSYPGGTTGTPTIDGEVVYHLARRGQLVCLEAASGDVKWSIHLGKDLKYDMPTWGLAGSPLVDGDRLLLNIGDAGLCLDKRDGSVVWRSKNGYAGYSTPYPFTRGGKDLVIFSNKRGHVCTEIATGTEMWRFKWLTRHGVNAAMPIVSGNHLFISSGYGKGGTLLRFADAKATTAPAEVWKNREMATQMNAALLIDGHLYGVHGDQNVDGTGLSCVHLASGTTRWTEATVAHGAVTAADGHLIVLSEQGELLIAPISPDRFQPKLRKKILPPKCWTSPVLAKGRLYCRNYKGDVVVVELKR